MLGSANRSGSNTFLHCTLCPEDFLRETLCLFNDLHNEEIKKTEAKDQGIQKAKI